MRKQANGLRFLSAWMTREADSGHAGMPLGMADVCAVLWNNYMNWSSAKPDWHNRDRFVLSCGHGSALLYSTLYCMGTAKLEDLSRFRQIGSRTPGHPELNSLPGVEMTTGPLGQGLAWGIGMAKAAQDLGRKHYTYIFCSDGDLMEGVTHESLALASLWELKRCIVFWDDNQITIDGKIDLSCKQPLENIFLAHGWKVLSCNGHDYSEIDACIFEARAADGPVCIKCTTVIGYGLESEGTEQAHGSPVKDLSHMKHKLGIEYDELPLEILALWESAIERGNKAMMTDQTSQDKLAIEAGYFTQIYNKIKDKVPRKISTRKLNSYIIDELDTRFVIGSADLATSTCTQTKNYLHFGVREHGMVATMGGMSLYGKMPVLATFLTFLDYARPAIRLAALMRLKIVMLATHDSICVGEDGPTHQPVEQINSYRIMPHVQVWRPFNLEEMVAAWESAVQHQGPTIIVCSRQDIDTFATDLDLCRKGAYFIKESSKTKVRLVSTGSEVPLVMKCQMDDVEIVSAPCMEVLERQSEAYKESIFNRQGKKLVSVEAGSTSFWYKYVDECIGIDQFGESGKWEDVYRHFGFAYERIMKTIS